MNWDVDEPTKNVFASISSKLGFVLNLNEPLFFPPCNSRPTPVYESPLPSKTEPLKNMMPALPLPILALSNPV